MTPEPQSASTFRRRLPVVIAALVLWLVPVVVRIEPRDDEFLTRAAVAKLLALVIALMLCRRFRHAGWIVCVWVPVLAFASIGAVMSLVAAANELQLRHSMAPLAGLASAFCFGRAVILGLTAIAALRWHPRTLSWPLLLFAAANTAAVSFASMKADRAAKRQDIAIQVLDAAGRPVPGAAVTYAGYSYGPGGKHVLDTEGGPVITGREGTAVIPSQHMRYETKGGVSKRGYRTVHFTIGMRYRKWDTKRSVTLSTYETPNIAHGTIPAAEPVAFTVYLPEDTKGAQYLRPVTHRTVTGQIGEGSATFLNVESGTFSDDPGADLRFDAFYELVDGGYMRPRLRIAGLNGTRVVQVPPLLSFSRPVSPYEHMFRVAPASGYEDETVIQEAGSSPGPMIYFSARDGRLYGRFTVNAAFRNDRGPTRCRVELYTAPLGSRYLE
jgi:hypothetical protein